MNLSTAHFRVRVDPSNPGQFFACCALLEFSDRLRPGAQGWFEGAEFCVASGLGLAETLAETTGASLATLRPEDATASPIRVGGPFDLRLDWWKSDDRRVTDLKVWAGTMEAPRICRAMQRAMAKESAAFFTPDLFNVGTVAYDPDDALKKVEPFYFDARRGPNAHSRDVGFPPTDLGLPTRAVPAVVFWCRGGLPPSRPRPVPGQARQYDYFLWPTPVEATLLPAAVNGLLPGGTGYRFESWYRTGQKKHKAFLKAKPL